MNRKRHKQQGKDGNFVKISNDILKNICYNRTQNSGRAVYK